MFQKWQGPLVSVTVAVTCSVLSRYFGEKSTATAAHYLALILILVVMIVGLLESLPSLRTFQSGSDKSRYHPAKKSRENEFQDLIAIPELPPRPVARTLPWWLDGFACCMPEANEQICREEYATLELENNSQHFPRAARHSSSSWPTPQEEVDANEILMGLPTEDRDQLMIEPPDVCHLLFLVRLLRGHGSVSAAILACQRMLAYRRQYSELIQRVRERIPVTCESFEGRRALSAESVPFEHIGLPGGSGSVDGVPTSVVPLATFEVEDWNRWGAEKMVEYIVSVLEQYSVILHNNSLKHHFLCRMCEVRDCAGMNTAPFLLNPFHQMRVFRRLVPIVSNYPEFVHCMVLFNATPSMYKLLNIFKRLFRQGFRSLFRECAGQFENDVSKLRVFPSGDWDGVSRCLQAACIGSTAAAVAAHSARSRRIPPGAVAYSSLWLARWESVSWMCASAQREDNDDRTNGKAELYALFLPANGDAIWLCRGTGRGLHRATSEGLLLLVADNTAAWKAPAHALLKIKRS